VNLVAWPKPKEELRDIKLERDFERLLKCVSLVYSARQKAGMKRRWPLRRAYIVASEEFNESIAELEEVFLELSNVKEAAYLKSSSEIGSEHLDKCVSSAEGDVEVFLYVYRDKQLVGEGLMRDLARRVQALRKELGYVPTDILESVRIAGLKEEEIEMLKPYREEILGLVRAREIKLSEETDTKEGWRKSKLDGRTIYIALK